MDWEGLLQVLEPGASSGLSATLQCALSGVLGVIWGPGWGFGTSSDPAWCSETHQGAAACIPDACSPSLVQGKPLHWVLWGFVYYFFLLKQLSSGIGPAFWTALLCEHPVCPGALLGTPMSCSCSVPAVPVLS